MSVTGALPTPSRRLLGDVMLVARGSVFGQAPFVLVAPLITRLYSPAEIGIYGLALAFVGITAQVAGLRFELAAISTRDSDEARALLLLSALAIAPVTCLCTALLCGLKLFHVGSYDALSWAMVATSGATIAAAGGYSTLRCWLVRRHRFRLVASSLTVQGVARAGIAVLGFAGGATLLMTAELVARLGAVWLMVRGSGLAAVLARMHASRSMLTRQAKKFWKYPALLGPSALIDAAASALPVPVLASCYGLEAAGKFALVQRLMLLPAALIVGSVGDVFHAHAAQLAGQRPGTIGKFLAVTAGRLLVLALAVYVPLALVAPFTAGWVFGRQWADAGAMIAALAPLCIAQTVVGPISRGLLLSGREERKLFADIACLVLPITTLYLSSGRPMLTAVMYFSAASVIAFVIYYLVIANSLQPGIARPVPPDGMQR